MMVTFGLVLRGVIVHDQADMLEEVAERLVLLHGAGEFREVFEPAGGLGDCVRPVAWRYSRSRRASAAASSAWPMLLGQIAPAGEDRS